MHRMPLLLILALAALMEAGGDALAAPRVEVSGPLAVGAERTVEVQLLAPSEPTQFFLFAVADADAAGLKAAQKRLKVERGFADYREMLSAVRPDVTAVCPRFADEHAAMVLAAVEAGSLATHSTVPMMKPNSSLGIPAGDTRTNWPFRTLAPLTTGT